MECCLCKKNQSKWISDYPLYFGNSELRGCTDCHRKLEIINERQPNGNIEKEISFFSDLLKNNIITDDNAVRYMTEVLRICNEGGTVFEAQHNIYEQELSEKNSKLRQIVVTSGYNVEGYEIKQYIDIISTEIVLGMGVINGLFAELSNITGTQSTALSKKLKEARKEVVDQLREEAIEIKANAIIGVDIDYTMFGDTMVAVIATGTAVVIDKISQS